MHEYHQLSEFREKKLTSTPSNSISANFKEHITTRQYSANTLLENMLTIHPVQIFSKSIIAWEH